MAKSIKNITNTTFIPKGSFERSTSPCFENEELLKPLGLLVLGISELEEGYLIRRSASPFHVIIFCQEGEGVIWRDDEEIVFRKGDMALIPAGEQHYQSDRKFSMLWAHLDPKHRRYSHLNSMGAKVWERSQTDFKSMFGLFYDETRHLERQDIGMVKSFGEMIALSIDRELKEAGDLRQLRHRHTLENLWANVSQDLSYPWSVPELSSRAHMSNTQLHQLCMELYYLTPMGLVTKLRMEQVRILLIHSTENLDQIASSVGYTSPFSLSRSVKKYFGISPREIRKRR